jgi:integrase
MEKKHVEHLEEINKHWQDVFSNLLILNKINNDKVSGEIEPYIAQLALLPVSKKSIFSDMLWDYDWETRKRSASVTLTLVRLDFSQYQHIPLGVITEIKCLFLAVKASPKDFGHRKNEIKPNTLIATIKGGLLFLDFVFSEVEKRLNKEYVHDQVNKLSDISLLEFEEAAKKTTLKLKRNNSQQSTYKQFFEYLRTDNAKKDIGIECQADYNTIIKAYMQDRNLSIDNKSEKIPYLETKVFDVAIRKASFNVVSFLKAMGEKINDPVMEKHYETLATAYEKFPYSKQEYEDYGALRLWRKEYLINYISDIFPSNKITKAECGVEHQFRKTYGSFSSYRNAFDKAYYSAIWVIGTLMGARPNVYSDLKIDCLDLESKAIVAEEHKGRDSRWNLFNDHWVVIPIMIDALKVIDMIGGKIFQNTYVFASPNTVWPGEINKPLVEMSNFTSNSFKAVTGFSRNDINTKINGYVFRHSLAHQMYRADVGLPIISYQLKHIVSAVSALARKGKVSQTTLGYGGIGSQLTNVDGKSIDIRHVAELEAVVANFDPNGKYMGGKAEEHVSNIKKFFNGYMEAGYTEEEIYKAMVEQGLAIINVGSGFCFGGVEDFDETLPCIGGLRCNPVRCHNAVVTNANAPKWREIYLSNLKLIGADGYEDRQDQIVEAIEESKRVLEYLGEALI